MTLKFAKKLPTLSIHYKAIPDPEPTIPEGLLPDTGNPNITNSVGYQAKQTQHVFIRNWYKTQLRCCAEAWVQTKPYST